MIVFNTTWEICRFGYVLFLLKKSLDLSHQDSFWELVPK